MAEAARLNEERGADIIDINFGCPVKKVVNGMAGSALMREEGLAARILEATAKAMADNREELAADTPPISPLIMPNKTFETRLDLVRNFGADDQRDAARFSVVVGDARVPRGWEFGYAMGAGKPGFVVWFEPHEPELMFRDATVLGSMQELRDAFAPGAMDAMLALALTLHIDPIFVGAHHLSRFVFVSITTPGIVHLFGQPQVDVDD